MGQNQNDFGRIISAQCQESSCEDHGKEGVEIFVDMGHDRQQHVYHALILIEGWRHSEGGGPMHQVFSLSYLRCFEISIMCDDLPGAYSSSRSHRGHMRSV